MKYEAIPVSFVKAEAGKHSGPPLEIDTNSEEPDTIVLHLKDFELEVGRSLYGEENVPIRKFAMHPKDAKFLIFSLITLLADNGDKVSIKLKDELHRIIEEEKSKGENNV
jgi:hypothetical protein